MAPDMRLRHGEGVIEDGLTRLKEGVGDDTKQAKGRLGLGPATEIKRRGQFHAPGASPLELGDLAGEDRLLGSRGGRQVSRYSFPAIISQQRERRGFDCVGRPANAF